MLIISASHDQKSIINYQRVDTVDPEVMSLLFQVNFDPCFFDLNQQKLTICLPTSHKRGVLDPFHREKSSVERYMRNLN